MKLLKKIIGYNIVLTFDDEEAAVFFDRSAEAVFVNLSRWRDLRYVDFLFCVFRIFDDSEVNIRPKVERSAKARIEAFAITIKLVLLLLSSSICLSMRGTIFTLISLFCSLSCFYLVAKLRKIDLAPSL